MKLPSPHLSLSLSRLDTTHSRFHPDMTGRSPATGVNRRFAITGSVRVTHTDEKVMCV